MSHRESGVRVYGLAGLLGGISFVATLVVLQVAEPPIGLTRHYISEFANGPLGWLFAGAAVAHGLGNLALDFGLRRTLAPGRLRAGAVLLFGLAAAGIVLVGLFPTDPGGDAVTLAGMAHRAVAATSFPVELVALFLFSAAFAESPDWRGLARWSFVVSAAAALATAGLLLAVLVGRAPGLTERLALGSFMWWELSASVVLMGFRPLRSSVPTVR